jgi:hypothetical protein
LRELVISTCKAIILDPENTGGGPMTITRGQVMMLESSLAVAERTVSGEQP